MRSTAKTNYQYSFVKIIWGRQPASLKYTDARCTLLTTGLWQNLNIKMFPLSHSIRSLGVGLFKKYNASSFCTASEPPAIIFKTTERNRKRLLRIKGDGDGDQCAIISGCQYSNRGHSNSFPLAFYDTWYAFSLRQLLTGLS